MGENTESVVDLGAAGVNEVATLTLRNEHGEPMFAPDGKTPATVAVYGPGSMVARKAQTAQANKVAKHFQRSRGQPPQLDAEEALKQDAEALADLTLGFSGVGYKGLSGRDLAVGIYSEPKLGYIAEQVRRFVSDWANFSKASPTT